MAGNGGMSDGRYAVVLRELGQALSELKRERGAPSYDRIRARGVKVIGTASALSKASMSEMFAGRRGPASLDRLLWLVRTLLSYDDGEEGDPIERRDPDYSRGVSSGTPSKPCAPTPDDARQCPKTPTSHTPPPRRRPCCSLRLQNLSESPGPAAHLRGSTSVAAVPWKPCMTSQLRPLPWRQKTPR